MWSLKVFGFRVLGLQAFRVRASGFGFTQKTSNRFRVSGFTVGQRDCRIRALSIQPFMKG